MALKSCFYVEVRHVPVYMFWNEFSICRMCFLSLFVVTFPFMFLLQFCCYPVFVFLK